MLKLNGHRVEITHFPDNTSQVWKLPPSVFQAPSFDVVWNFTNEADFLALAQLKALLDTKSKRCKLEICYLPYARQDKEIANDTTFALRPFAGLLNSLKFDEILIHDPHSVVALSEIQNSKALYPTASVKHVFSMTQSDLICYPDKGARTRYGAIYPFESIYGEKVRDQQTGRITSYAVVGDPQGKRVLIVDDICDGGATFTLLAQELMKMRATELNLFITHGIFSKGLADIHRSGIKRIFTREGEAFETQNQISYKEI
jgi:ribose-phosphate pyrophosphokinase